MNKLASIGQANGGYDEDGCYSEHIAIQEYNGVMIAGMSLAKGHSVMNTHANKKRSEL